MLYDDHMQRFAWASELFFKECPKAPAELLQVFSYVCANNGCQKLQVEKALGLSSSAGDQDSSTGSPTSMRLVTASPKSLVCV